MWQRPIIQYIEEPSISALRVRAEKEEEMKTLDDYWKDRIQKQEVGSRFWWYFFYWISDNFFSRTPSLPTLNWPRKKSWKMPNMSSHYLNQLPRAIFACKFHIWDLSWRGGFVKHRYILFLSFLMNSEFYVSFQLKGIISTGVWKTPPSFYFLVWNSLNSESQLF